MFRDIDGHLPESAVRLLSRLHTSAYRLTGGRVGARLAHNDMLLLTTTGRRSGRPHTVPLLFLREEPGFVVFASFGGHHHHPAWYLNLEARPEAVVEVRRERISVASRTTAGGERRRLWERGVAAYEGYAGYQSRTDRLIPVVALEPRPG